MGNCLVTKLKENVQNDNLLTIGEIKFKIINDGTYSGVLSPITCEMLKNGVVIERDEYGNYTNIVCSKGDIISIKPKYDIMTITILGNVISSGFYNIELNYVLFNNYDYNESDFSIFKDAKSINFIQLRSNKLVNINSLCKVNIKKIDINGNEYIDMDLKLFASNNSVLTVKLNVLSAALNLIPSSSFVAFISVIVNPLTSPP